MAKSSKATIDIVVNNTNATRVLAKHQKSLEALHSTMEKVSDRSKIMLLAGSASMAGFVALASVQEEAIIRLNKAIELSGGSITLWSRKLQDAAASMQKETTYGDEFIMGLMAQAMMMGVSIDKTEEMTKAAVGLAKAYNMELSSAMKNLMRAQSGTFGELGEVIPKLKEFATTEEKVAYVMEQGAKGYAMAKAETEGLKGSTIQLKNLLGDLGETVGSIFVPAISGAVKRLKEVAPVIQQWIAANEKLVISLTVTTAAIMATGWAGTKLIGVVLGVTKALKFLFSIDAGSFVVKFIHPILGAVAAVSALSAVVAVLIAMIAMVTWKMYKMRQEAKAVAAEMNKLQKETTSVKGALSELGKMPEGNISERYTKLNKEIELWNKRIEELYGKINSVQASTIIPEDSKGDIIKTYSDQIEYLQRRINMVSKLRETYKELLDSQEKSQQEEARRQKKGIFETEIVRTYGTNKDKALIDADSKYAELRKKAKDMGVLDAEMEVKLKQSWQQARATIIEEALRSERDKLKEQENFKREIITDIIGFEKGEYAKQLQELDNKYAEDLKRFEKNEEMKTILAKRYAMQRAELEKAERNKAEEKQKDRLSKMQSIQADILGMKFGQQAKALYTAYMQYINDMKEAAGDEDMKEALTERFKLTIDALRKGQMGNGFSAQFENITGLYRRIQASAASTGEATAQQSLIRIAAAVQRQADIDERNEKNTEQSRRYLESIAKYLNDIIAGGMPGRFGA